MQNTTKAATRRGGETPTVSRAEPLFDEAILAAGDVCSNCYRLIRQERPWRRPSRSDVSVEFSPYTRRRRTTTVDYGPSETALSSIGVFCDCGVESAYDRLWKTADDDRVRRLIKHAIRTFEAKGYAVDRERFATLVLDELAPPECYKAVGVAFSHAAADAVAMDPAGGDENTG